jgi:nonsense-mediated mRNA decay protein 3
VRQRVEHKKTFFFLEQLLIARRMQDHVLDMEIQRDGMDLFFSDKVRDKSHVNYSVTNTNVAV